MDYLIKNAKIVDGTGAPAYMADVAITGDSISKIGTITASCDHIIDADGRILLPGFIDPHSHADVGIFNPDWAHQRIVQGITTDVVGHCGPSPAPNCPEHLGMLRRIYFDLTGTGKEFDWPFQDFRGWLDAVAKEKLSANYAFLVGHGTIRGCVMGDRPGPATAEEVKAMQDLLDQALSQGAIGLGLGLSMFPGNYADTQELIELAKIVKKHDGIIVAHRRDEGAQAYESVDEMLTVARATGVRMNIAHVKVTGSANWGKGKSILKLIEDGLHEGLDLSLDAYPYITGYTQLFQIFPVGVWGRGGDDMLAQFADPTRRAEIIKNLQSGIYGGIQAANGGSAGIQIIQCSNPDYDMKTLAELSQMLDMDPGECAIHIIETCGPQTMMFYSLQCAEELNDILLYPHTMIMSDGAPSGGHAHPRYMGTFSQILEMFVQTGRLTMEEAVQKMTYMPAQRYRFFDRGMIKEGNKADLILLDWDHFENNCTYDHPNGPSKGFSYVFLNGEIAAIDGRYTGKGHGVVLRCNPRACVNEPNKNHPLAIKNG